MRYDINKDFEKLEKAGIETYGLNVNVTSIQNVHGFFISNDDTQKDIAVKLTLENHIYKNDEETTEIYGWACGRIITTFDHVNGRTLNYLDVIDSCDQDTYNCLSVFMDEKGNFNDELMFYNMFYVDKIIISDKYRNNGLGSILVEYIKYKFADITTAIVLQPFAFEWKEKSVEIFSTKSRHLCNFYKKHGFENYREDTWIYHES